MGYRTRRKNRTEDGDGVMKGSAEFSAGSEADGRAMRRRYALYTAAGLLFFAAMIALLSKKKSAGSKAVAGGLKISSHFKVESHSVIPYGNSSVQLLRHEKSGLAIMTMVSNDVTQDATFGLSFRTVPDNNHGTALVVANSIFDGSVNYPVRDVWDAVARGSLQTYNDLWTDNDRSVFVFSTRNKVDFSNSIKVMMDAVVNPKMVEDESKWIFRQEGWRVELLHNKDLILNGNAVNEARASQMDSHKYMWNTIYEHIFPNNNYRFNSNGNTEGIVMLTHQEMIEFYHSWYHPSNGQAFCYGPEDFVSDCLAEIDAAVDNLEANPEIRERSKVAWQPFKSIMATKASVPYPSDDSNDYRLALAYILNDAPMDSKTEVAWILLEELLMCPTSGIMSNMVVDLNLGDDITGGLDLSLQQATFVIGVTGIKTEAEIATAEQAINDKLKSIVEQGFDQAMVIAAASKLDYRFRDESCDDMPTGPAIWKKVVNKYTYDQDPRLALNNAAHFAQLKEELANKGAGILYDLISKRLINSHDKLTLEMYPSPDMGDLYTKQEKDFIAALQGSLTKEEGIALLRESETLRKMQKEPETEESLATVPRLKLSDLPKKGHEYPIKVDKDVWGSGLTILEHELPDTNGMAYVDFAMDISKFDFDDLVLLPLFCGMLVRAGTTRVTPTQQVQLIDKETGGVKIWPVIEEIVSTDSSNGIIVPDGTHMVTKIVVRTSTIASTTSIGLFSVIRQIMTETNMQQKDVALQVLTQLIDDMEDDIQANGYKYTSLRIGSRYTLPGFVKEQWLGVTQLLNLRRAFGLAQQDWDSVATRLENMKQAMVTGHRNGMLMSVTGDKQALKGISPAVEVFTKDFLPDPTGLTPFPDFATTKHPWVAKGLRRFQEFNKANSMSEAFVTSSLVNHVAKGGLLYDVGERIRGSDVVMTEFLEGYYLYDTMRFDLGAYDAWAELDVDTGVMLYQSMRDPNVVATLTVFEEGGNSLWLDLQDKDSLPIEAEAAIIGVIGAIDGTAPQPSTTGYAAMLRYLKKETPETRQKWRDEVLASNKGQFMAMIERLGSWGRPSIAVAGGRAAINMAIADGTNMTACTYKEYVC